MCFQESHEDGMEGDRLFRLILCRYVGFIRMEFFPVLPNLCLNQLSTKFIVMQCRTPSLQLMLSNRTSSFSLGKITNFKTNDPTKKVCFLLASWSRVLLEKLTGSQLVK